MRTTLKQNFIKAFFVIVAFSIITGCGANDNSDNIPDIDLSSYLGYYSGNGYSFDMDFEAGSYLCKDPQGRVGQGSCGYENSELYLIFDDFYYSISSDSDNNLTLRQNGSGIDVESLDGFVLSPNDMGTYFGYDINDLNGQRSNENGVTIIIDLDSNECSYTYSSGIGASTVSDDSNGKGPYIYMGSYKAYPILATDGSVSFEVHYLPEYTEPDENILTGTFTK